MAPVPTVETEVPTENQTENAQDSAPSKPTIGIIYPPPELRNIVDKTASFVARNGPEFEARIRQNEINNKKFNFLNPGDPYNAYYQHKVKEFREGKGAPDVNVTHTPPLKSIAAAKADVLKLTEIQIVPKEPPPDYEFIIDPPSISAFDLDIVKLTAQFVARNGRQFLTNLMNREQRNYQFDFLRPQHSLFNYFTKLLEQYTKILIPPKDLMTKLKKESDSPKAVLDQVRYRVEWTRQQEAIKRREEEEAERERVQYAQIDWHDFVVVETVDYQPNEQGLFPPPTNPDEVGSRVLHQQRIEEQGVEEVEMEVESDEEGSDKDTAEKAGGAKADEESSSSSDEEEDKRRASPPPLPPKEAPPLPPPLPPQPDQVVIRKDYNPKVVKPPQPVSEQFLISPITGERIPADKMQEHMRIGLLDPRWVEQRDRAVQEKMTQEEVYAQGTAIESSLKQFAERRTDIFGSGVEETAIGKKIGEEEKKRPEKVTWDGHTASMEAATRAARANITIEEQIQQIHKIKGLLPDEEKERIGPSKPQDSTTTSTAAPVSSAPPVKLVTVSSATTTAATTATTQVTTSPPATTSTATTTSTAAKSQQPPLPTTATPTVTVMQQRPPLPPIPPIPMPPVSAILPPRPILPPPQGLIITPIPPPGPPPPHILAMPRPPMPPVIGPPGTSFVPPMHPIAPPPPPQQTQTLVPGKTAAAAPSEDEPAPKKQKTEDSLISEEEFLKKNKGPVTFRVQVPSVAEKPEWKLNGQVLAFTLPLTDQVSVIKAKIHESIGMPPGKQKLQLDGMFIKDSNSLAYYNLSTNSIVALQVKERGGRKK
ncbi:splicing factor 3A subunit 1-like isoform X2 [Stegodyphus dumicola]|uniref:splicing factor 3A subunit 1-like isoform X2 n=1 Tax=Stegodyphus dumicola TaxID=202533 RepID=UPI0015AEBAF3|nr:splicing factor 3A subunit 1-like isoform X2 [Stegodyphus dumicola]